jgi:phenylalanyl-tRNA synthetase alpha chain
MTNEAVKQISECSTIKELEMLRLHFLGKQGIVSQEMSKIKTIPNDEKKSFGQRINKIRNELTLALQKRLLELKEIEMEHMMQKEEIDITLPGRVRPQGSAHLLSHAIKDVKEIFTKMGFKIKKGPEIDDEWHNFTALNMPAHHPARTMHDTFYLKNGSLLRTHTSNVQIRSMMKSKPPHKFISIGRTYRADFDATHTPMFHQVEGLVIDRSVNMSHLKYTINKFIKLFFGDFSIKTRFRTSFFPFTEPSAEVDIMMNNGKGWLEVLGCGMVHTNVLKNVDIDHKTYQGFAFGMGIERLAMIKYGIDDLRNFFASDIRYINKYSFK